MGLVVRRHARAAGPRAEVLCRPARGVGAAHPATAHHDSPGGPRSSVGRGRRGMAAGGPGAARGVEWGCVLAHPGAPPPPCLVLHTANVLQATEIHTLGCNAATIRWVPPESGATRLSVAHFKEGGPTYDDALSQLGEIPGPLLLMLPTDPAAALREELDGCDGLRVGRKAIAHGTLLALFHRDVADGCQWGTLVPHLTGRHTYMGHPHLAWDDLIAAFHDHGILPDDTWQEVQQKTLGQKLPTLCPRPPAGALGPPLPKVGRPLAPPSRPLVAGLPPDTHLPPLRGMKRGVIRRADRRQQVHTMLPGGRVPLA